MGRSPRRELHSCLSQSKKRVWSWYAGPVKQGIFEIEWQVLGKKYNRMALALENKAVAVIDISKVPALQSR